MRSEEGLGEGRGVRGGRGDLTRPLCPLPLRDLISFAFHPSASTNDFLTVPLFLPPSPHFHPVCNNLQQMSRVMQISLLAAARWSLQL